MKTVTFGTFRKYIIAALLGMSFQQAYSASEGSPLKSVTSLSVENSPILKLQNVDEEKGLWRGQQPANESDYAFLKGLGIKTIINMRWEKEVIAESKLLSEKQGIEFLSIPYRAKAGPTSEQLQQIFSVLNDPLKQPVYLHCTLGKDRTGLIYAIYRVKYQGWTVEAAYREWLKFGFSSTALDTLRNLFFDQVQDSMSGESRDDVLNRISKRKWRSNAIYQCLRVFNK